MNNQFYVNELFPTRVMYKDAPELITPRVIQKAKEILTLYQDYPFNGPCNSTVKTLSNVLELPDFAEIKQFLLGCASVFLDLHKINGSRLGFVDSWLNQYDVGGYQDLHMHHDSMISGVIYLESSGNKDFILQAPWHFQQPKIPNYIEQTLDNAHNAEFNSVTGRAIFFMSHALHRTLPATSSRISLSFNIG